ncbi:hypothetical protein, partial [Vibrio cholerae]|uniref:hypothetical protein n=1 Tax=Vibrio cholerae TaxID=666 RepID=UPI001F2F71F1
LEVKRPSIGITQWLFLGDNLACFYRQTLYLFGACVVMFCVYSLYTHLFLVLLNTCSCCLSGKKNHFVKVQKVGIFFI